MPRSGRRRSTLRRTVLATVALALCALATTGGVAGGRALAERRKTTTVFVRAGGALRTVELIGPQTVTSALLAAGVVPRDGRLLSVHHTVLDPHLHPATLTVGGRSVERGAVLLPGATVVVTKGADEVEGTTSVDAAIAPPPFPDVLRHAHHRGTPGLGREVRGAISGEVVSRRVLVKPVAPRRVTEHVVALTFDDGPNEQWTPTVLAILREKGIKATFCEVGNLAEKHPDVTKAIVAAGHQLCNHTLDHVEHLDTASAQQVEAQVGGGAHALKVVSGKASQYYRPPGGHYDDQVIATARRHGEALLYWKVDTEDWRRDATPTEILDHVKAQVDDGAIILMHDAGGQSRAVSVVTLGLVIDWLKSQGYGFVFPIT